MISLVSHRSENNLVEAKRKIGSEKKGKNITEFFNWTCETHAKRIQFRSISLICKKKFLSETGAPYSGLVCKYRYFDTWPDLDTEYCRRGLWPTQRKQTDQALSRWEHFIITDIELAGLFPACWIQNFTSRIRILPEAYPAHAKRLDPTLDTVQRDRNRSRAITKWWIWQDAVIISFRQQLVWSIRIGFR